MRDVEIWQQLRPPGAEPFDDQPSRSVAELLVALEQLGRGSLRQRAVLLGLAAHWRDHEDPRVRAAAIAALSGATGIDGLRAIIAALDDDHDDVRAAALEALCESAKTQELRLAHALFHPREDVRRGVIPRLPGGLAGLGTYLRTDPACASLVAELPLRSGLRLALDLHARDLATDAELCQALAKCEDGEL
ncbi:MAG TPA: HEAT repeat domain-containing protein, partial [Enhygromyxa sp.]|nr:HEAT repeat domain-containing protein [Enhygromyxa sp.]